MKAVAHIGIWLWCIWMGALFGQEHSFTRIGLEEGLSQSSILAMDQDKWGFWWFGTQDGLNHYDGYEFKTYKNRAFESSSLSNNRVQALLADSRGWIWIGTWGGGLNVFDPRSQVFKRFLYDAEKPHSISSNYVHELFEDKQGNLWVSTLNGLNRLKHTNLDPFTDTLSFERHFYQLNRSMHDYKGLSRSFFEDTDGTIWAGSFDSVYVFTPDTNKKFAIQSYPIPIFEYHNHSYNRMGKAIVRNKTGQLLVGTNHGIVQWDASTQSFIPVQTEVTELRTLPINTLIMSTKGDILIGTEESGVYFLPYDTDSKSYGAQLHHYNQDKYGPAFSSNIITHIQEDETAPASFWIGTSVNGLIYMRPNTRKFHSDQLGQTEPLRVDNKFIGAIAKDRRGEIWMGMEYGLLHYDPATKKYTFLNNMEKGPDQLRYQRVYCFKEDKKGNMWIGTHNGLVYASKSSNGTFQYKRFMPPEGCSPFIYSMTKDQSGKLLLGNNSGLSVFDPETRTFEGCGLNFREKYGLLGSFLLTSAFRDSKNRLWLGSTKGLMLIRSWNGNYESLLDIEPERFDYNEQDSSSLPCPYINSITEDDEGNIWLGSSHGLIRVKESSSGFQFQVISEYNGLANDMVYAAIYDSLTRYIWMSSNRGISRYHIDTKTIDNYEPRDGIQGYEFNQGAFYQAGDGEIIFGGLNGFTRFYPDQIATNPIAPTLRLTGISKPDGSFQDLSYEEQKLVSLAYHDNSFTLHFTGLNYNEPAGTRYIYRLYAADEEPNKKTGWSMLGTQRQLSLSKLVPGEYVFQVKGSNRDGSWEMEGDRMLIEIRPPF